MKKINSIGYGGRIVAASALFLFVIPLCLRIMGAVLPVPRIWIYVSLALGGLIAVGLAGLLAIELARDKRMIRRCIRRRNTKLHLGTGRYECQSCGSRDISENDTTCRICGIRFGTQGNGKENRT